MKKEYKVLLLLAFLKFILPFILQSPVYEPHRDEFLYLAEAHHMAWGYMEIPPLLSVFAWISNWFGHGIFWIKFWPSLFGAAHLFYYRENYLVAWRKIIRFVSWISPFYFRPLPADALFISTQLPGGFFWTMIAYSIFRFIQSRKNKWIYILGISIGLGMISKYSVAFFVISILAGLLITRNYKIFLNKHFYFAGLIALLIFLPTLLWEYQNHFPVIVHMKELQKTQLQYVSPKGFLVDQIINEFSLFFYLDCRFIFCSF